ncbi:hypothetical protein LINPERPRIM_LOCUS3599 [Linum perenne]
MRRRWEVEFIHIYCECNHAVNYLTSIGHERPHITFLFHIINLLTNHVMTYLIFLATIYFDKRTFIIYIHKRIQLN